MFLNTETREFKDAVNVQGNPSWNTMTVGLLQQHERNVAVGNIAKALRGYASEQPKPDDPLCRRLYELALRHVDFYWLALELVQSAEQEDPSLIRRSA